MQEDLQEIWKIYREFHLKICDFYCNNGYECRDCDLEDNNSCLAFKIYKILLFKIRKNKNDNR